MPVTEYEPGDLLEYRTIHGGRRKAIVTRRCTHDGEPGFVGRSYYGKGDGAARRPHTTGTLTWGFDANIVRVFREDDRRACY